MENTRALQTTAKLAHPGHVGTRGCAAGSPAELAEVALQGPGWGQKYRGGNGKREKHWDDEGASREDRAQAREVLQTKQERKASGTSSAGRRDNTSMSLFVQVHYPEGLRDHRDLRGRDISI